MTTSSSTDGGRIELSGEEREKLFQEFRSRFIAEMAILVRENSQPMGGAISETFRNLPAVQWNSKVLGMDLAARHYGKGGPAAAALLKNRFVLSWRPTRFDDYLHDWFVDTCAALRIAPLLHRKIWEEVYVINVLRAAGKLTSGVRGLVFGVGQERLPAYFASQGVDVLATDLAPDRSEAKGWMATAQHGSLERLYYKEYLNREEFLARVQFCYADMNKIPQEWNGQFDFCWSVCAFEHLGSIENGLRFVENTGRLLRPGGVSVHTTEFNYTSNDVTIDNWGTVLFRRRDFEQLADRLKSAGYQIPNLDFDVGASPVDLFVDIPPYPQHKSAYYSDKLSALHLKLIVDGFPATCYGLHFSKSAGEGTTDGDLV